MFKRYSLEEKLDVLKYLEEGSYTVRDVSRKFSIATNTIQQWIALYKFGGEEALNKPSTNISYTKELKESVVKDYLTGNYTLLGLQEKYGVRSQTQIRRWIRHYINYGEVERSILKTKRFSDKNSGILKGKPELKK